jgi:hypothetical protein
MILNIDLSRLFSKNLTGKKISSLQINIHIFRLGVGDIQVQCRLVSSSKFEQMRSFTPREK